MSLSCEEGRTGLSVLANLAEAHKANIDAHQATWLKLDSNKDRNDDSPIYASFHASEGTSTIMQ